VSLKRFTGMIIAVPLLVLLVSACSVHNEIEPVQMPAQVSESFSVVGTEDLPDRWWTAFDDENLKHVIETALADNLSLKQAWNRLGQVRALARISGSFKYPTVEGSAAAQRQRTGQPGFNPSTFSPAKTIDSFSVSATASYQVDLWSRIDSNLQADLITINATRKDIESTAMTVAASVAELWYSIAEQQAILDLLKQQLEVNKEFLKLVELRFSQGSASALDVFQQRLQLESIRNEFAPAETTLQVLKHQLAVLLGRDPSAEIPTPDTVLPQIPDLPNTGVPADLLRNRPDIRSAELRIYAADKRVAAAIADRFPGLGISSSGGANANDFTDLFDRWFINIAGSILGTIFDGGRKEAAVDQAEVAVTNALLAWKISVLNAVREVEDSLVQEQGNRRVYKGIEAQIRLAEKTLQQSRSRYINGLTNYLNVLSSLQSLQQLQRAEVSAYKRVISNRINLYVALGGDWTEKLEEPELKMLAGQELEND
jgi:multidrug efflux system outer membrane protein